MTLQPRRIFDFCTQETFRRSWPVRWDYHELLLHHCVRSLCRGYRSILLQPGIRRREGWRIDAMSTCFQWGYRQLYNQCRLKDSRGQSIVEILNTQRRTNHWGTAWASIKPESDGIVVGSSVDWLNEYVMNRSVGAGSVKISSIDTGIVGQRISLTRILDTGTWSILSLAGAEMAKATSRQAMTILLMVIYLMMINPPSIDKLILGNADSPQPAVNINLIRQCFNINTF